MDTAVTAKMEKILGVADTGIKLRGRVNAKDPANKR